MRLNLGCNDHHIAGWINVDIVAPADNLADLSVAPWPFDDSSVDEILARDVIEHLPDKRQTMNELFRILKPGGRVTIQVPDASEGDGGFCDPTHVSYWTRSTFEYFVKGTAEWNRFHTSAYYGIKCAFKAVSIKRTRHERYFGGFVMEIQAVLEAIK